MSQSADAAITRWSDIVHGRTTRGPLLASNIMVRGDIIYSYGSHFELARPLRNKKGEVTAYLLNGDSYSNTTSGHQSSVRYAVRNDEHVIIPHEALTAAGVEFESIRILHTLPDRYTETRHHSDTFPEGAHWHYTDDYETVDLTAAELEQVLDAKHAEAIEQWESSQKLRKQHLEARGASFIRESPRPERPTLESISHFDRIKRVKVGRTGQLKTSKSWRGDDITVTEHPDGTKSYDWTVHRHWLGESLIRAMVGWSTQHICEACNGFGTYPAVGERWDRACPECRGNGTRFRRRHRWATFLSGFDHQEARPLYFFCELPYRCKATTVPEAYEALKPDAVLMAEQMGRQVSRQGDIFAVPTTLTRKDLRARGARIEKRNMSTNPEIKLPIHLPYILKTNHTATEVAYLPGGLTLARGLLYHDPNGRNQDHARRKMGDGKAWHVVVKNTVPISERR